jgi:hypothetical protein
MRKNFMEFGVHGQHGSERIFVCCDKLHKILFRQDE